MLNNSILIKRSIVAGVILSSSGFFAPFVAAQSGEKMVCKSGGDMVASVEFKHLGFRASTPGFGHSDPPP